MRKDIYKLGDNEEKVSLAFTVVADFVHVIPCKLLETAIQLVIPIF